MVRNKNTEKPKNRRKKGRGVKRSKFEKQIKLVGANCAGLRSKMESFDKILAETKFNFFPPRNKIKKTGHNKKC